MVAHVCHWYPGEFRGGDIEAPLFFLLYRQLGSILALERVQTASGVMKGTAVVWVGESATPALEQDRREAFGDG